MDYIWENKSSLLSFAIIVFVHNVDNVIESFESLASSAVPPVDLPMEAARQGLREVLEIALRELDPLARAIYEAATSRSHGEITSPLMFSGGTMHFVEEKAVSRWIGTNVARAGRLRNHMMSALRSFIFPLISPKI